MRSQERAALAAIIASGLLARTAYTSVDAIAGQALAVADAILNKTEAEDKANNSGDNRT